MSEVLDIDLLPEVDALTAALQAGEAEPVHQQQVIELFITRFAARMGSRERVRCRWRTVSTSMCDSSSIN